MLDQERRVDQSSDRIGIAFFCGSYGKHWTGPSYQLQSKVSFPAQLD
jgi:hypothetical protein